MRHICVLLHGIECIPEQRIWVEELAVQLYPWAGGRIEFIPRKYGYVGRYRLWWNWDYDGYDYRDHVVDHEERYFQKLQKDISIDTKVSIIAHSLGGYIAHELMRRGVKFHNVISLYAAADENQVWEEIDKRFDNYYIYWSPNDEILPMSDFGKLGLVGPQQEHHRVHSIKTNETHNEFMDTYTERRYPEIWVNMLEAT